LKWQEWRESDGFGGSADGGKQWCTPAQSADLELELKYDCDGDGIADRVCRTSSGTSNFGYIPSTAGASCIDDMLTSGKDGFWTARSFPGGTDDSTKCVRNDPDDPSLLVEEWNVVDCSDDGSRCVAGSTDGWIAYSHDQGATWTKVNTGSGKSWGSLCSSSDGMAILIHFEFLKAWGNSICSSSDGMAILIHFEFLKAWGNSICSSSDGMAILIHFDFLKAWGNSICSSSDGMAILIHFEFLKAWGNSICAVAQTVWQLFLV
jgi:hypothetical protein